MSIPEVDITLRDMFAGEAMAAMLVASSRTRDCDIARGVPSPIADAALRGQLERLPSAAYLIADMMLDERAKAGQS